MKKRPLALIFLLLLCSACSSKGLAQKPSAPESYVQENWPQFSLVLYESSSQTLTLTQNSTMTYDSACSHGKEIYSEELALETYLDTVQMIAYDVSTACQLDALLVVLQGVSTDGQPIYTVSSSGELWACWTADTQ